LIGIVLAAGKGMRMRPLSDLRPKSLLPLLDVPLMAWAMARLVSAGVDRIYVNCNREQIGIPIAALSAGERLGVEVLISREPAEPLGTAGALKRLEPDLTEAFAVINADTACDVNIQDLLDAHYSAKGIATLLAIPAEKNADFVVDEGWVKGLFRLGEKVRVGHLYGHCAVFEPEVLKYIPPHERSGLYETVLMGALQDDMGISALEWNGYFRDVGSPAAYLGANLDVLGGVVASQGIPEKFNDDQPVLSTATAFVGGGANVTDVELRHTVVGRGAHIEAESRLERCVVWDGAVIELGDYRDSILTGSSIVEV
jgi:NDP-sugar pyrophosphorylase family protein